MRKEWSDDEVAYLEKYYEKRGVSFIAKKLGRTNNSVKRKAQKLGYNAYVCEDIYVRMVARCFNCDSRVVNRWIDKYGLPCRTVKRGQATCKLIDTIKFWKWAKEHKDLIPWAKYERRTILPEPPWLRETLINYNIKNNRKKITSSDKRAVVNMREKGKTFKEIAIELNRTEDSVKHIWRSQKN